MSFISQLVMVADAFCAACKLSRSRVSTLIFNDGKALDRLARGGDLYTASYQRAMKWFSEHWPADVAWPSDVPRPVSAPAEEAA